jgi:transcriptional regulator with XRE-family HTH domain
VNELTEQLRQSFTDEEYRNAYAESFLNSFVAAQIKVLREEYPLTQQELAEKVGTKQSGVARLENVNYSSWKVETLRKIARALKVRLKITFEEWGTLPADIESFNREALIRAPFDRDPVFSQIPPPMLHPALGRVEDVDVGQGVDVLGRYQPRPELGSMVENATAMGAAARAG